MGRYAKAIGALIAGAIATGGAIYTNAPPEGIDGQATAISAAIGALVTAFGAYMPRNSQ